MLGIKVRALITGVGKGGRTNVSTLSAKGKINVFASCFFLENKDRDDDE